MSDGNTKAQVTTVIPTYRRSRLVRRAVASVLSQTYPYVRASVYDNASNDETSRVMTDLAVSDNRVTYYCHPDNVGSYSNFNYGIRAVETPFFSLLSDDDFLVPDFYARAMQCFDLYPEAGFVCMPTMVIDEQGRVLSPPMPVGKTRFYRPSEGFVGLVNGTLPNTWTGIVFRKDVADAIGPIDTTAGPFADGGYVWNAGAMFPFVVTGGVAAVLTAHKNSNSGTAPPLSAEWPIWRERMVSSALALHGRWRDPQQAYAELTPPRYRSIAFLQVMQYLSDDRPDDAIRAAVGLRACGFPLTGFALQGVARLFRRIPVARSALKFVRNVRKEWLNIRACKNSDSYSHVLKKCAAAFGEDINNKAMDRRVAS